MGKADEKLPAGPPVPVAPGGGPPPDFGRRLESKGMGTSELADGLLSAMLKRPVTDTTGIQGTYNFSLEFLLADPTAMGSGTTADTGPAPDSAPAPTLFNALQQLGLNLEARKEPVELLVVDHAEKVPTEN